MTYLIHGATGAQGAPAYAALARAGKDVTAAVRNVSAFTSGPAVAVENSSVQSLTEAYRGADGVFVHLPIGGPDQQLAHAKAIVSAIETARPTRVVVSTSGYPIVKDGAVEVLVRGIQASGVSVAIIEPKLYLENLLLPMITAATRDEGILRYPLRDDYAVSWCSHLDIADVVVRLFVDTGVVGTVTAGALPGLVGADLAKGFSVYLGRDVNFEAQDPDDFGAQIAPLFGQAGADSVTASYHWRATQQDEVIRADRSAQRLLGIEPRSVEQWLRDVQA